MLDMEKIVKEIIVRNSQGLHARPAAMIVQIASKYAADVTLQKGDEKVNGKSIMGILTLGVQCNSTIIIEANGEDAKEVVQEIENLLSKETVDE